MISLKSHLLPEKKSLLFALIVGLALPLLISCGKMDASPKNSGLSVPVPGRYAEHATNDANDEESATEEVVEDNDEEAPATLFTMNGEESLLYAQLWKDRSTLFSGMAHNHVLRATQWTGNLTYHPTDLSQCFVEFTLPVNDFQNDEDFMRQYVGLEGTISEFYRSLIHEHMLSDGQLNGDVFSHITFESSECLWAEDTSSTVIVTGALTILGQSKTVQAQATFQQVEGNLHAQGSFEVTHSDFGFAPYEAFWGSIKNGERIKISFNVVAKPAQEPAE